jgi:hypothetical protein
MDGRIVGDIVFQEKGEGAEQKSSLLLTFPGSAHPSGRGIFEKG